ncbi:MAG TPA: hypothetical protein VMW17_15075 [Candidatus Binatia bacterium]|nr:hypothetical protein [Candidatus Binatia bacterium]
MSFIVTSARSRVPHRRLPVMLAAGLFAAASLMAHSAQADGRRRTICHIPGGRPQNITVDDAGWRGHERHGDFDGPCERNCNLNPGGCQAPDRCSIATCNHDTGQCVIRPKVCPDTQCTQGVCSPYSGKCLDIPLSGSACDDGNACTTGDICKRGRCVGSRISCDDHNDCTKDSCNRTLGCQNIQIPGCSQCPNGPADCQDGNLCNGVEQCVSGQCVPGTPPTCVSTNPCLTASCDPASGCTLTPNTDPCDDGNPCTTPDVCGNGVCQPGPPPSCDDDNPCTVDSCDPAAGGCQHTFVVGCDKCRTDQDCGGDQCSPQACQGGQCVSLPPPMCDDGNVCTTDGCDPAVGCFNLPLTGPQCAPGDVCSGFGRCDNGVCANVPPLACDDGNPCTTDTCTAAGCSFAPGNEGAACATASGFAGVCTDGSCVSSSCNACKSNTFGCTDLCPAMLAPWMAYVQCVYDSGVMHGFGAAWCDPTVCGVGNCMDVAHGIFGSENPIGANCTAPCTPLP